MSSPGLRIVPLTLVEANDLVTRWHRHHRKVVGHRFAIGVIDTAGELHGAAIIGRPVARVVDSRTTAEVTRLVTDGSKNACSMLYAAAAAAARAMGFIRIQTYTLASEPGVSLRASGWVRSGESRGGSWSRSSRAREDKFPTEAKVRWVRQLNNPECWRNLMESS